MPEDLCSKPKKNVVLSEEFLFFQSLVLFLYFSGSMEKYLVIGNDGWENSRQSVEHVILFWFVQTLSPIIFILN